jgi:type I restriction enzyme S subunit
MNSKDKPKLGDYFSIRKERGEAGLPTLSVTMNDGLINRDDLDRKTDTRLGPDEHLRVIKGDIAYNMMRMWQGAFGRADHDGIVSPAYVVLQPKKGIDTRFGAHWFKSARMIYLFWAYSYGLTEDRLRLYADDFCKIPAAPPSLTEQRRIADVLDAWDRAVTTIEALIKAKHTRYTGLMQWLFDQLLSCEQAPLSIFS